MIYIKFLQLTKKIVDRPLSFAAMTKKNIKLSLISHEFISINYSGKIV